jgi:hypothetical protein
MSAMFFQRFKKSAQDATTVTLVPSTSSYDESKPTHLKSTQVVFTQAATLAEFWGAAATDGHEYEITVKRLD